MGVMDINFGSSNWLFVWVCDCQPLQAEESKLFRASDKPFTIEVVKLTSPTGGGASLKQNDLINITWTAYETSEPITKVQLFYTKNAGTTWNSIPGPSRTTYPPGNYSQSWNISPVGTTPKTNCEVKVVLSDAKGVIRGSDMSDAFFAIEP